MSITGSQIILKSTMFLSIFKTPFSLLLKRWLQVAVLTVSVAMGLTAEYAHGERYAEWSEDEGLTQPNRDILLGLRKSRAPDKAEVPFPKYPDAKLLVGDTTGLATVVASERLPQTGILLVSRANLVEVARWYEGRLPSYSRFDYTVDDRRKVLFIADCKDFKYERDSAVLSTKPHVVLSVMSPALKALAVGYETTIELAYEESR